MLKWLITLAGVVLVLGLLAPRGKRLGLGRLPGDLSVRHTRGVFYFPFVTTLVLSLLASLLYWSLT